MSKRKNTSWTIVSPKTYVECCLGGVGMTGHRIPVSSHAFMYEAFYRFSPLWLSAMIQIPLMKKIRQKALEKAKKSP